MAVVSSGEIKLNADINVEVNGSVGTNVSLSTLSTTSGKTAPHGMTEFYGYTSADPPQSDIDNVTSLAYNQMRVNCYIQNNGGAPITSYGLYFGTNSNCTSNTKYTVGTGNITYWNKLFTGLSATTTYYMQSWAANSAGEQLGQRCVAVTTPAQPVAVSAAYGWMQSLDTTANSGPFNGSVYFGSNRQGFMQLSRAMPSGSMYAITYGQQTAINVTWDYNDYGYAGALSAGDFYYYNFVARGSGSNIYTNTPRQVYGNFFTVGNYSLTRLGNRIHVLTLS